MRIKKKLKYTYNENTLLFEQFKPNYIKQFSFYFICFFGFIVLTGISKSVTKTQAQVYYETSINVIANTELNHKTLEAEIAKYNFKFPKIIYAQAVLESNNFKSNICKQSNNLFGMKEARQRTTTANGTEFNHASYLTWQDSVIDRALFETSFLRSIKTKEQYFDYISKNYAEDTSYVIKLKKIINKNQN
jgi:uncharacterized FlgJ-related protein